MSAQRDVYVLSRRTVLVQIPCNYLVIPSKNVAAYRLANKSPVNALTLNPFGVIGRMWLDGLIYVIQDHGPDAIDISHNVVPFIAPGEVG